MSNSKEKISDNTFKQRRAETWSQSTKKGDWTEEINVEKLDNKGYLVVLSKYGTDSKGNYKSTSRKIYSDVNPLDDDETDSPIIKLSKMLIRDNA